ncbi:MAG: hypothetical protein JXR70_09255 [Spirochaetales bacterium]|nr:hypothetical protein [Spirochaetales bacterium]
MNIGSQLLGYKAPLQEDWKKIDNGNIFLEYFDRKRMIKKIDILSEEDFIKGHVSLVWAGNGGYG